MKIQIDLTNFQWDQVINWLGKIGKDETTIAKKIKSFLVEEKPAKKIVNKVAKKTVKNKNKK